jgi:histidine triad (HIT) family protein
MKESIFTKIIKGEIPCHKVYEDERSFAFMDIHPIQPGHVLVVTKKEVGNFYELDEDDYHAFFATVQKVAKRLKEVFPGKKKIGLMVEGLEVEHVHAKLFPIDSGEEFRTKPDMAKEPDHAALAKLAQTLAF